MMPNEDVTLETISIPSSAAEAWAVVHIDVAEKLDADQVAASVSHTPPSEGAMIADYITCDAPIDLPIPTIDMFVQEPSVRDGRISIAVSAEFSCAKVHNVLARSSAVDCRNQFCPIVQ